MKQREITLNKEINFLESKGYIFDYCDHCETQIIYCPKCKNNSCSGGGCGFCMIDWPFFRDSEVKKLSKTDYEEIMYKRIK